MTAEEIQQVQGALRPGPRRKKSPLRPAAVMLSEAECKTLDAAAEELGRSRSDVIREAVRVWLKKGRKQ